MRSKIELNQTDIKKAIKIMMVESDIDSFADLARSLDVKETTFRSAVNNGSVRLADFMKIADIMGYKIVVEEKENE